MLPGFQCCLQMPFYLGERSTDERRCWFPRPFAESQGHAESLQHAPRAVVSEVQEPPKPTRGYRAQRCTRLRVSDHTFAKSALTCTDLASSLVQSHARRPARGTHGGTLDTFKRSAGRSAHPLIERFVASGVLSQFLREHTAAGGRHPCATSRVDLMNDGVPIIAQAHTVDGRKSRANAMYMHEKYHEYKKACADAGETVNRADYHRTR